VDADQAAFHAPGHDHSIWQLVLHCAYARYAVWRSLEGRTDRGGFPRQGGYWSKLPETFDAGAWAVDKALLKEQHHHLLQAIRQFDPRRLDEHATQEHTFTDLLWGVVMHDLVHVGELQMLKHIYQLNQAKAS
jgi:hypothetical protein